MLALVDGQYKFRWVDVDTAGSCSDAQIFNTCHLKRKIDDGNIGFPDPAPITQGGRDVPYFILADDAFALKTWLMKPYGRRMLTSEERIANYRISRGRRVVENTFGILVSRFRVMMTTIELPPETWRDVVLTCVALHNILRSQYQDQHGGQQPDDDEGLELQFCRDFCPESLLPLSVVETSILLVVQLWVLLHKLYNGIFLAVSECSTDPGSLGC